MGSTQVILVDTHVVVWLALDADRLSKRAVAAINSARAEGGGLALSAISLFELAALAARSRIQLRVSIESFLQEVEARFAIKPLTGRIAAGAMALPDSYPRDPMDRIIGATALVEGMPLVTADEGIRQANAVQTIW